MPGRTGSPPDSRLSNMGMFAPPLASTSSGSSPSMDEPEWRLPTPRQSIPTAGLSPMGDDDRAKMEAFRKVKPLCVTLMGIAQTPPSPSSQHSRLLSALSTLLPTFPPSAFTPGMISYIMYPVTNILRRSDPISLPDSVLEHAFEVLAVLIQRAKEGGGIEQALWEQLWRFTVLSLGQGLAASKGKRKEISQDTQLAAAHLLSALLEPDVGHPSPVMLGTLADPAAAGTLLPTLFSTLTILLDLCNPSPPNTPLQLSALATLRPLVSLYLRNKPEMLASVLPGIVSTMTKLVANEGKGLKGDTSELMAGLLADAIVGTLGDELLRDRGVIDAKLGGLEQLAEDWDRKRETSSSSPTPSAISTATATTTATPANPFPPLTASYLAFTTTQLLSAIPSILNVLSAHPSAAARSAAIDLAAGLIKGCMASLEPLHPHLLNSLLTATQDDFDPVRHHARRTFRKLLTNDIAAILSPTMQDLLATSINSLPRLIMSEQSTKVEHTARLVTAIAEVAPSEGVLGGILGPTGGIEKWGWGLLTCLEFGRPAGWDSTAGYASRASERGWDSLLGATAPLLIDDEAHQESQAAFPSLPLRYVDSAQTTKVLARMFTALGKAGGIDALHTVDYFVRLAKAKRRGLDVAKSASALWVAERVLEGVAERVESSNLAQKKLRKAAKEIAHALVELDDDEDEEDEDEAAVGVEPENETGLVAIERTKGVHAITTLLDRTPRATSAAARETRKLHQQAQRGLITALSLSLLSTTSKILSTAFRPLLLHSLYILLSHLASPHALIQTFAEVALVRVAYHTGYASPQNLVIDNVDYVINVVSQRLTYRRLSSQAPLVLIAMIRMVGEPIVPLVHDIVDEIFDALDDFHGYETLASTLLAVLVTLIKAMEAEVDAQGPTEEFLKKRREMNRIDKPPNPEADFAVFLKAYSDREEARRAEMEELLQKAPHEPWTGEHAEDGPPPEDVEVPATRAQEVCTEILRKASYFLTHRSGFLRARVCALFASAVPVLVAGSRESDLLPIVNSSWPYILNRLSDPEPYVVAEAAALVESLVKHVGDFMAKRVLENAWPAFKRLLDSQSQADKKMALARRGGHVPGTTTAYSNSHRLHLAVVSTMTYVVKEVPVADDVLWQMITAFRPFLDAAANDELQVKALTMYTALADRDADAVWVALKATIGTLEGDKGSMSHLHEPMWNVRTNVETVLALC